MLVSHSFLLFTPHSCAVELLKIVTGVMTIPMRTNWHMQRTNLHIDSRSRLLYIAPQSSDPLRFHKAADKEHMHCARHRSRLRVHGGSQTTRDTSPGLRGRVRDGSRARCRTVRGAVRCGLALARASADTRQPPSQWRSGRVRARALRRSLPILSDPLRHLPTKGWTNPPCFSF